MKKESIVSVLRIIYKALPYVIALLGGGAAATLVSGCKIGSLVSMVAPAI